VGSTRYLSDNTGNSFPSALRFDAFGQRSATSGPVQPTTFQYAGGWAYQTEYADATDPGLGLQYLQQRYYDPAIGRFISRDPIGFAGGLNLFAYCGNDPINCIDPLGLRWREILGVGGSVVGGLAGVSAGGVGALPGSALGAGLGAYIGSRLDGASVSESLRNGALDAGISYLGGRLIGAGVNAGVNAYRLWRARQAAQVACEVVSAAGPSIQAIGAAGEDAVAQVLGIGRNIGPGRVTVPGTGRGGFRVPDFAPALTIRLRGTVVEVKNYAGDLYITQQLRDLIRYARSQGVPLEIFTNASVRGRLADLAAQGIVRITPIP
jgi:RHS repeat-associated protein